MNKILKSLALICTLTISLPALATDAIYTNFFNNPAAGGYDVVAYFTEDAAVKGSNKFKSEHLGAEFHFASLAHKTTFDADPAHYAPQYGGHCAYAVSQGYTASGDPEQWTIVDDKLYLNYNKDVLTTWRTDTAGFIKLADQNWPGLLAE
jgi:YHS domain-containing protein